MISAEELLKIIERIQNNTASEEELRIYNAWCNLQQQPDKQMPSEAFTQKQGALFRKINKLINRKRNVTRLWAGIAAAIILIAVLPATIKLLKSPASDHSQMAAAPERDIAPGINSATLILSNGRRITLAAGMQGKLAEESGTEIIRTSDSTVLYKNFMSMPANSNGAIAYNTLTTARAQQYQLVLPDGSKIWLNAATSVRFPVSFSGLKERRVELDGEAYFEVAKDASKPFIVHSRQQDIKVLGTHFNVNSYADESEARTTLLEGSVNINGKLTLRPGEQAKLDREGKIEIAKVKTTASIAWQKGYFEFNDENVYEIMRKISRWYDVEVIYEGTIPLDKMEGTVSRFQQVSKVLSIMQATGLLKFRIEEKRIYVSRG
ncbi:hypothetical protein A8C56_05940 [Niabella ginsenosidivorans]|uniref:Anti-sigma factor n=1 Tax=Niabella ginsenosidivorans TaxID=1176587 RepID=A0A1A9HYX9_9BACT|nr:FecR family protein [Niabella ginsenosidivorans]ANH80586.1 hypothetical protein A8C56_05940 [Niabella ginsenosidivorans]